MYPTPTPCIYRSFSRHQFSPRFSVIFLGSRMGERYVKGNFQQKSFFRQTLSSTLPLTCFPEKTMRIRSGLCVSLAVALGLLLALRAFLRVATGTIGASKGEIIGVLAGGVAVLGVVGYLIYHERHKHPTITGCPTSNGDGLSLTNERDKKAAPDTDSNHASPRGIEADDREHSKHCQAASGMSGTAAEVW